MSLLNESLVTSPAAGENPVAAPKGLGPLSAISAETVTAETIPTPVAALCAGDFHDRWERLRQVSDLGEVALGDLIAVLQDSDQDWEARWFAARALGNLPHPTVISALIATFAGTLDDDLRQAVAAALTQIGPAAIAALGEQLAQPTLRPTAVQALARIHHPDTVPLLLGVMDDPRSLVRAMAIDALSAYADPTILPAVQRGLADSAAAVRSAAIRALLSLRYTQPPAPAAKSAAADPPQPKQMVSWLLPLLGDSDCGVAQQAAYALGRLPCSTAAEALLQRLLAPTTSEQLQICLVQALAWQNTAIALSGLIQAWPRVGQAVRLALVQGLAALAPDLRPQATGALLGWLQALPTDPAYGMLRCHLVLALGHIGTITLEPQLQALLEDPDLGVQLHAEAALRQLRDRSGNDPVGCSAF